MQSVRGPTSKQADCTFTQKNKNQRRHPPTPHTSSRLATIAAMGITFELDLSHGIMFLLGMAFCYFLMNYRKSKSKPHSSTASSSSPPTLVPSSPNVVAKPEVVTTPPDAGPTPPANRRASLARSNSSPLLPKKQDGSKEKESLQPPAAQDNKLKESGSPQPSRQAQTPLSKSRLGVS